VGRASATDRRPPFHRLCQAVSFLVFCLLLFWVAWPYSERFSPTLVTSKELLPAESFLWLDPLTGLTAAIGGGEATAAIVFAAVALAGCIVVPRWFCSHVCPLGTTLDLFHWAIGKRLRRLRLTRRGAWVHARWYLLAAVAAAALMGLPVWGYLAAIPMVTRGLVFVLGPVQLAVLKHPGMVRPVGPAYWLSVGLFAAVVGLGLLGRRFWCRCLCPSGALFSLAGLLRLRQRRVTDACTRCGRCLEACPFDAIRDDFTTRHLDCASCPECAAVCPADAIEFGPRRPAPSVPPADRPRVSRRGLFASFGAGAVGGFAWSALVRQWEYPSLLRPPGAVAEERFLVLCIRCGACFKACPGPVLHPAGFEAGLDALWTPVAVPTWAGCRQECNFCGQVCPTGAIRPLPLEAKRRTPMGLAAVNKAMCLPHSGRRDCQLCYDECRAAGYDAIEMREIQLEVGDVPDGALSATELEEASRILAPVVDPAKCVGCGLCEYRCHAAWVRQRGELAASAIVVTPDNADRP